MNERTAGYLCFGLVVAMTMMVFHTRHIDDICFMYMSAVANNNNTKNNFKKDNAVLRIS